MCTCSLPQRSNIFLQHSLHADLNHGSSHYKWDALPLRHTGRTSRKINLYINTIFTLTVLLILNKHDCCCRVASLTNMTSFDTLTLFTTDQVPVIIYLFTQKSTYLPKQVLYSQYNRGIVHTPSYLGRYQQRGTRRGRRRQIQTSQSQTKTMIPTHRLIFKR